MSRLKARGDFADPTRGPLITRRFVLMVLLIVLGIAWIAWYYVVARVDPTAVPVPEPGQPKFMDDLGDWNYAIGFGLVFLGLIVGAHPSTPLGRGRGVVVAMISCFLIGLAWICVFYALTGVHLDKVPVFNDLDQYNLVVGIGFMAVGFVYATRWE